MTRGEIWWAGLSGGAGFRPVAVVSRAAGIVARTNVTMAEVTRVVRGIPCEVALGVADGMPVACVINTDNLHTIPPHRLRGRITVLSDDRMFALVMALRYSLDLDW